MNAEYKIYKADHKRTVFSVLLIIVLITSSILCGIEFLNIQVHYEGKNQFIFSEILIEVVAVYYILVLIHELGHLTILKFCGYTFRVFMVGPLIFINDQNKLKIRLKLTNFITGGLVSPDLDKSITCEEEYQKFIKDSEWILFGGVLFNILVVLISILLLFFRQTMHIGFLMLAFNLGTIISCLLPFNDLSRIIELKKYPNSIVNFLLEEYVANPSLNQFCKQKIFDYVEEMLSEEKYDVTVLSAINYIMEQKIADRQQQPEQIRMFLTWLINNFDYVTSTGGVRVRLLANKIVSKMVVYKMICEGLLEEKNIKLDMSLVNKHPLHGVYMELDAYARKQATLDYILD